MIATAFVLNPLNRLVTKIASVIKFYIGDPGYSLVRKIVITPAI
jgi:hypothetical protein